MHQGKKVVCVIPARLSSSRFPKKILITLLEKPLLEWVYEAAKKVPFFDEIVFAIDSEEAKEVIQKFHGKWLMTPTHLASGTDRLVFLKKNGLIEGDLFVNWQADEPLISKKMIEDLLQDIRPSGDVWTLKKLITDVQEVQNPHIAKVVTDKEGYALYFSRSAIPFYRDEKSFDNMSYYKHVGLYAYSSKALKALETLPLCEYEEAEKLEQLRFLFHGLKIKVNTTEETALGIDLPEHQIIAEQMLSQKAPSSSRKELV